MNLREGRIFPLTSSPQDSLCDPRVPFVPQPDLSPREQKELRYSQMTLATDVGVHHSPHTAEMPQKKPTSQPHVHYHKDGSVWAKGQMLEGVLTGEWEWFRKDGTIMRSGQFENGIQVGEWTTYDKDGRVVKVTKMKPQRQTPAKSAAK